MIRTISILLTCASAVAQGVFVNSYTFGAPPGNNLLTGLQAGWRFEEASGDPQDSSGNSRHLDEKGAVESSTGIQGNARRHEADTNDDYFDIASAAWNSFGSSDHTIAFWFNAYGDGSVEPGDMVHVAKADSLVGMSWGIGIDRGSYANGYAMTYYTASDGAIGTWAEILNIEFGETLVGGTDWYFVAVVSSGTTFTMYLGKEGAGVLSTDAATYATALFDNSTVPVTVGVYLAGGAVETSQDTEGDIDELYIWNRALSECEIFKFYNAGVGRAFSTFDANPCL